MSEFDLARVRATAALMRADIIKMITAAGSGHPGGSLSAVDILATLYFGGSLVHDARNPRWEGRDRFILSKGHAAPVLYAALAHAGYFGVEELQTLRKFGSLLQGHPDSRKLPGVEVSTGSLGQGLSIAAGLAYGLRLDAAAHSEGADAPPPTVFTLLGDGELQEGQVWEAAMFAAHQKLGNLIALVDNNDLQIDGSNDEVNSLGDIAAKFTAFGWRASTIDGHDPLSISVALKLARSYTAGPVVVVARTVKGKGVSFMENQCGWHGKAPSEEQCAAALQECAVAQEVQ